MKNVKLSLLCILGLQSIMMQAAVESKDDYQDQRQAIIDEAMQPENYIELKKGFAQGLNVPSFHDLLEQNVPQSDDEDFDMHAITAQAEDIVAAHVKDVFLKTLDDAIKNGKNLDQYQDPLFKYVMQHKDDYMRDMVYLWLYEWSFIKNNDGETPFHFAAWSNSIEIIRMFIDAGADVNIQDNDSETPLYWACSDDHCKETVQMLILAGADINVQDNDGCTPLYKAAVNNCKEIVQMLILTGADVNLETNNGCTPLSTAAFWNHTDAVRILINAGADINIRDDYGRTPLHWVNEKNIEIACILIDAGADINTQDNDDCTPLHCAVYENSTKIVYLLLAAGAHVNIQDNYGRTAEQLAHTHEIRTIFTQVRQQKQDARAMVVFNNQIKKDWR